MPKPPVKISVFLDRETHADAKRAAALAGVPLTDFASHLIAKELKRLAAKEDKKRTATAAKGEQIG